MKRRFHRALYAAVCALPLGTACGSSPTSTGSPPRASTDASAQGPSDGSGSVDNSAPSDATAGETNAADGRVVDASLVDATGADGPGSDSGEGDADGAAGACAVPVASASAVALADFESGMIPSSTNLAEGFRDADVSAGTVIHPGASGTSAAARFDFGSSTAIFYQGMTRPQYLDGSSSYNPDLGNAIEFYVRVPSGSMLLSSSAETFGFWTYHWLHGDPWVGANSTGGDLTDSQMHGYSNLRFDPASAGAWQHVVLSTSAFAQSRGNYHFYAARAVTADQTFFGSLRQFEMVTLQMLTAAPTTLDIDELRLITLQPTATVCPAYAAQTVSAAGGDVTIPLTVLNPTAQARSYRTFISSEIGLDRQTLETAMHDTDNVVAVDDLQGGVGADGGLGAAELFAVDATGRPTGASIVASGTPIAIAAGGTFRGLLVHHVKPAMLGASQTVATGGHSYTVQRNTLTTSLIVWDPSAPRAADSSVVFTGSNADSSHPSPPGFPAFATPPSGWASTDVSIDQVGGYLVSTLTLTP